MELSVWTVIINRSMSNENIFAPNDLWLVYVVILPVCRSWNVRACPYHTSALACPRLRSF